jgi:hypothetical protein
MRVGLAGLPPVRPVRHRLAFSVRAWSVARVPRRDQRTLATCGRGDTPVRLGVQRPECIVAQPVRTSGPRRAGWATLKAIDADRETGVKYTSHLIAGDPASCLILRQQFVRIVCTVILDT